MADSTKTTNPHSTTADEKLATTSSIKPELLDEPPEEAPKDDELSLGESLGAWRDRAAHAKTIKDHKRARAELASRIDEAQAELDDNRYILENFDDEMAAQRKIADRASKDLDREQKRLADFQKQIQRTQGDLDAMVKDHRSVASGYSDQKDTTQRALDQAKKVASGLQSQVGKTQKSISNLEKEIASLTVTVDTAKDDATIQTARGNIERLTDDLASAKTSLAQLQTQLASANTEKASAEAAADGATKAYKEITNRHENEEKKLRRAIKDLEKQSEESRQRMTAIDAKLQAASSRMDHARTVKANPAATDELAAQIDASRGQADEMDRDLEEMETVQQGLKKRSGKAVKTVIALGIAVLIVIAIILVFVYMQPGPGA